jgi:pantoate--beta-alanine ligase
MITVIPTTVQMRGHCESLRQSGKRIAFVPTMGFLHEGHLSLMRIGRRMADVLVVSIFVNPTQFGPGEDFESYPRNMERDLELCRREGAELIFTPTAEELYSQGFETRVQLAQLPQHLCGLSRPVFFNGVATVVTKLFNIVRPHAAVFGEKDFQQLQVIRRMVRDLDFGIDIVAGPIVREADGLAMSSRNAYLTPEQRPSALSLSRSLTLARERIEDGLTDARELIQIVSDGIHSHPENRIDYVAVCHPETLEDIDTIDRTVLLALAVWVGKTRLIDNALLTP